MKGDAPGSAAFAQWLADGNQADMQWLERSLPKRTDPGLVLEGARSVIMLGINYGKGTEDAAGPRESERPIWARYALNLDYHDTVKPGLVKAGKLIEA
ncbi:MAG: DUF1730 domain-containing protein [Candidatus Synoicihabitans palmerolidicus]|nr:DUF1730 domain-containing protein [Candidatus Synoicihabitans palmerolidicus]